MRTLTALLIASAAAACLSACGRQREAPPAPAAAPASRVLATVDGAPITEADVNQRTKHALKGGGPDHDVSGNVLATLIRDELVYRKGLELGLDREPGYAQRLEELQAQLRAFQRRELAVLYRSWLQRQSEVSDAEARAYFEANAAFIQTRFHVLQILSRGGPAELEEVHRELQGGATFEAVASRRADGHQKGSRPPWDLGELAWTQVPKAWRGALDRLAPGQVSGVLHGENERAWILKLAGKRVDPGITLATERDRIGEALRQQKAADLSDRLLAEAKARATIVYSK